MKFCNINRLLFSRTLDGKEGPISDEDSDDGPEGEAHINHNADNDAWLNEPPETEETSDTFAVEDAFPEVNLSSKELRDVLSSQPSIRSDEKDDDAALGEDGVDDPAVEEDEDAYFVDWH